MTKIKICGITSPTDAVAATVAGADFIGLLFASSRRKVTIEMACDVVEAVRKYKCRPAMVGVFVNSIPSEVNQISRSCKLDIVQLSGNETLDYCRSIDLPIIKTIHISADTKKNIILNELEKGYASGIRITYLLDTKVMNAYGGTGSTFNWNLIDGISKKFPIIVAGGLDAGNVGKLVEEVNPWGVDVSSGVEADGQKDSMKIKIFIETVRKIDKI